MRKLSILLLLAFGLMCVLMGGCARFRDQQSGSSPAPSGQGSASAQGDLATNAATATITSGGTITTVVSGGKVTTVAGSGPEGAASSSGALDTSTARAGHGPLFYFYILFAAASVIGVLWAVWHHYRWRRPVAIP